MNIQVLCRKSKKKAMLEAMAAFCVKQLNIENSRYTLWVLPKNDLVADLHADGVCFHGPNDIAVCIDSSLTGLSKLTTFAHEMIHAKQIARGTLKMRHTGRRGIMLWQGKEVKAMAYEERPWEAQAFREQGKLAADLHAFISRNAK